MLLYGEIFLFFLIFICLYFSFFLKFVKFVGVTLLSKSVQVSSVRFYDTPHVCCMVCSLPRELPCHQTGPSGNFLTDVSSLRSLFSQGLTGCVAGGLPESSTVLSSSFLLPFLVILSASCWPFQPFSTVSSTAASPLRPPHFSPKENTDHRGSSPLSSLS